MADEVRLTAREREVAGLAARGNTNRAIAERLVVSVRTVENHLDRVYAKLGLHNRKDLGVALLPVRQAEPCDPPGDGAARSTTNAPHAGSADEMSSELLRC